MSRFNSYIIVIKKQLLISFAILQFLLINSCSKVPISNRSQMNLLPESELVSMGLTSYHEFLAQNPPAASSDPNEQMVKNVGARIQSAISAYLSQNNLSDRTKGYNWEFNLVNKEEVNAWCMPGGKVVVYSGILPHTQNETGLAIVMGHEIAHAVARHGNERMSQMMLQQLGGVALGVALANKPEQTRTIFNTAYGLGTTVGILLPYSRLQESEADKLGLIFAAMAGYDPREAIPFWKRMASMGGTKPPEFLSDHPSDERRIKDLQDYMSKALKYYKPPLTERN